MSERPDATLLERAHGGDQEAFRLLVERHAGRLFAVAFRVVGEETAADDVVQEALLRAWRARGGFDGRSEVSTWLHRIVVNCAYDHLRRLRRGGDEVAIREQPVADDDGVPPGASLQLPTDEPDPERRALSGQIAAATARALPTLSALEQAAFVLRHLEGRTTEEIAATLGVNLQAGKHAVFRAVQKLRLALAPFVVAAPRGPAGGSGARGGDRGTATVSTAGRPAARRSHPAAPSTHERRTFAAAWLGGLDHA